MTIEWRNIQVHSTIFFYPVAHWYRSLAFAIPDNISVESQTTKPNNNHVSYSSSYRCHPVLGLRSVVRHFLNTVAITWPGNFSISFICIALLLIHCIGIYHWYLTRLLCYLFILNLFNAVTDATASTIIFLCTTYTVISILLYLIKGWTTYTCRTLYQNCSCIPIILSRCLQITTNHDSYQCHTKTFTTHSWKRRW